MQIESAAREFHPELISRRGEATAWILGITALVAWIILLAGGYPIFWGLPVVAVILLLAAMSISLGNWMDRQSMIKITSSGIIFKNGVRNTELNWDQIQQVKIFKHKWGDKVHVIGDQSHFSFRKFGEVKVGSEVKGSMGFKDGDEILRTVLDSSHLREIEHDEEYYYYARE